MASFKRRWYGRPVSKLAETLRQTRIAAELSEAELAELVGVCDADILAFEAGRVPSMSILDHYACAFGVRVPELLAGTAAQSPAAVLFRSMPVHDGRRPALRALVRSSGHRVFGEFLREVRDRAELSALLDRPSAAHPWSTELRPRKLIGTDYLKQAADMAAEVRQYLGLTPHERVPSMKAVVRKLGIQLHFVQDEELDTDIQGAAVLVPEPAILVNLGGQEGWWRTRMTIAHELCHLLFDRWLLAGPGDRFAIFSPKQRGGRKQRQTSLAVDPFDAVESRANAFAASFIAPATSVRSLVERQGLVATSEEAIHAVCEGFAVGRRAAINRLRDVFALSDDERDHMLGRAHLYSFQSNSADSIEAAELGPRGGLFIDMVMQAFTSGKIDANTARGFLRLRLSEPLPGYCGERGDPREPWISRERLAQHEVAMKR